MNPVKQQLNLRISAHTAEQIDELAEKLGLNKTEIVLLAIDRLARDKLPKRDKPPSK